MTDPETSGLFSGLDFVLFGVPGAGEREKLELKLDSEEEDEDEFFLSVTRLL